MAGDEGFEPPITGPEPGALPLGQSPMTTVFIKEFWWCYFNRFSVKLLVRQTNIKQVKL